MYIQTRTNFVVFAAILFCLFILAFISSDERYIAAPIFICTIIVIWLWMKLWDRDQKIPFFDAGFICALATLVYTIYPLINYWVDGLNFGILSDSRLQQYRITPPELGFFHLRHTLYLFSFSVIYSASRVKGNIEVGNVCIPSRSIQKVIFLFFFLLTGYFIILKLMTGINYNTSYEPEAFANSVSTFASAPLFLKQISGKLGGILFLFKLALLYIVVSRCEQRRWLIILLIWISAEIINAFLLKGARTGFVLFIMAIILFYHRLIKNISARNLVAIGLTLFVFFIFLGIYRQYSDFTLFLSQGQTDFFSRGNEFQSLLGTAYDVLQFKKSGVNLPWYLYINDIINILPPQQLMSFEKVPAYEWYLRQIGLSQTGLGFMWGVISQSIVGFDWIELALRGAILGYILARIHRWYVKHQEGFLETLLYIFLCLKVYYTFRDTTFILLANFVWEVIPFYIILRLGIYILKGRISWR